MNGPDLLREVRARSGMSVRSLARAAGVSPATVDRIEHGRVAPTATLELEHGIRAATDILQEASIIIIGSQSVLGSVDDDVLPPRALWSMETSWIRRSSPRD